MTETYGPGALVRVRGREWIVLQRDAAGDLALRPLGGADSESLLITPGLDKVELAAFAPPSGDRIGPSIEARLLRDALLLTLRRGAGPFRSFGRLSFEPRAYQLAPLLMALKLDPVRLLIADDVGIGKTIEAGLIAREMLDRGEINALSVICPPHLVDQWVAELARKFSIDATPLTASNAARLERNMRVGASIFEEHPFTVVSLDYIKAERRSAEFVRACRDFVIVDEAHACVGGDTKRTQRYNLLRRLCDNPQRHVALLTATPHSGDATAFAKLAGLLDRDFERLELASDDKLRERFGGHFIQRRRADIDAWKEPDLFPIPETKPDATYRLHPEAARFYEDVLDYCADVTERAGDARRRRLAFWGTLALMRCVASSPVAAWQALKVRAKIEDPSEEEERLLASRAFDGDEEDFGADDAEPAAIDDPALARLVSQAEALARDPARDEKLKKLIAEMRDLLADKFNPVVFCRFIGTAEGVGAALQAAFPDVEVATVTGLLPAEMREKRVEELGQAERRILVATDCLSEGINLQAWFDAVVHYDLSWNPTRHQQREGRVNRFGQKSKRIRSLLIYGENNPVDGAVLQVILRKAERIRKETGVPVPLPDNDRAMTEALMQAVLLRRKRGEALQMDLFPSFPEARKLDAAWTDASEREKRSQTIYAQRALKPEAVIPEWQKAQAAIGAAPGATRRFLELALERFGAPLGRAGTSAKLRLPDEETLQARLKAVGVEDGIRLDFEPGPNREFVHRAHPLVATIAEALFERALDADATALGDAAVLARSGAWTTRGVDSTTIVALLRIRYRLESGDDGRALLAEEAQALAWTGTDSPRRIAAGEHAFALLDHPAEGDLARTVQERLLERGRGHLARMSVELQAFARERAAVLAEDHDRVRASTMRARRTSVARVRVEPVTPVDVIGLYVLTGAAH